MVKVNHVTIKCEDVMDQLTDRNSVMIIVFLWSSVKNSLLMNSYNDMYELPRWWIFSVFYHERYEFIDVETKKKKFLCERVNITSVI